MRFSEQFGVKVSRADDWFDPLLSTDTRLFVDPFQIYEAQTGPWRDAHPRLISFFNLSLKMLAEAGLRRTSAHWSAVERLFMFPEPSEFCLGYSEGLPFGSGAGRLLQQGMLAGAREAIRNGVHDVKHFEELALFEGGFGPDRISDVVCNVLKAEFIVYTQEVAARHHIETEEILVEHASWSEDYRRWNSARVWLPINPYTGVAVLLTPRGFLRDLPSADADGFWEFAWSNVGDGLRADFNYDIARRIDRRSIAKLARRRPGLVRALVENIEENPKPAYDFRKDPEFAVSWYDEGRSIADTHPLKLVASAKTQFCDFISELVQVFVHYVEDQGGWKLLWNGDRPRAERDVQLLFRGILVHYCRANDIDLTGEANAGRGPVDFKFSQGWDARAWLKSS